MGAGARPAFASEVTYGMLIDNMGCCKHPYQGLEVPVYLSTIDAGNGNITDRNFQAAKLHFDVIPACQCPCDNKPMEGRVVKNGIAYPLVSHGGPSACPQCIPDADLTVGSTTLKAVHKSKFHGAFVLSVASTSTPSKRRLLDGVAVWVLHHSIQSSWPRHRREMTS